MKKTMILILAAATLLAYPVLGQTDATAFETAIHGKAFGVKGYPGDPVVRYNWIGGKLLPGAVDLHAMMAFFPDTVRLKSGKVLIEGQSSTLVKAGPRLAPMGKVPMRLEIDLQGADAATVFPQLQAALFFPSLKAALDGLPDSVSDMIPYSSDGVYHSACNCSHIFQDGKWVKLEAGDTKLTSPAFIGKPTENPALDQKAIDEKVSGTITLIYYIGESGRVDEVWVAKPLSPDTDEMAAKTGRANVFRPAAYDGKPVGTVLLQTIPVNLLATDAH